MYDLHVWHSNCYLSVPHCLIYWSEDADFASSVFVVRAVVSFSVQCPVNFVGKEHSGSVNRKPIPQRGRTDMCSSFGELYYVPMANF